MKFRPRFSLRTLLVVVALAAIPMGWTMYQLSWIRQRHAFRANPEVLPFAINLSDAADTPWQLELLGERDPPCLVVPGELVDEARKLFPGVAIAPYDPSTKKTQ